VIALVLSAAGGPQEFPVPVATSVVGRTFPALRRFSELAGPRLPPFRKLLLQIDGPEF
jgi:hypothetical protein